MKIKEETKTLIIRNKWIKKQTEKGKHDNEIKYKHLSWGVSIDGILDKAKEMTRVQRRLYYKIKNYKENS